MIIIITIELIFWIWIEFLNDELEEKCISDYCVALNKLGNDHSVRSLFCFVLFLFFFIRKSVIWNRRGTHVVRMLRSAAVWTSSVLRQFENWAWRLNLTALYQCSVAWDLLCSASTADTDSATINFWATLKGCVTYTHMKTTSTNNSVRD